MEESKKFRSVTDYLNMLNMAYYVEVGIPLVLFLAIYLRNKALLSTHGFIKLDDMLVKGLILVLIVGLILIGESIYRKRLKVDFSQFFLQSKLHVFFQASLLRYSAYFGASIVGILGLFYFMEGVFVGMYMVTLFAVSILRPTKKRIIATRIFNEKEIDILKSEDIIP